MSWKNSDDIFSRSDTIQTCGGYTKNGNAILISHVHSRINANVR